MSATPLDLSVYLIVGPSHVSGDMVALVKAAVAGGVSLIQYRDKTSTTRDQIEAVRSLKQGLEGTGVPVLVNDRVDVALAAGADGVHVGQSDMDVADARRLLGPDPILGITVKNEGHVRALDTRLVDYASIGGVFETSSKVNPDAPIGLGGLEDMAAMLSAASPTLPRCAIAGIDETLAASVISAGVQGVCIIRAITEATDPEQAARTIKGIVEQARLETERNFA